MNICGCGECEACIKGLEKILGCKIESGFQPVEKED